VKSLHIESLARVRETSEERTEVTMSRVEEGAIPIPDARHTNERARVCGND
jgi:hypothetical protein